MYLPPSEYSHHGTQIASPPYYKPACVKVTSSNNKQNSLAIPDIVHEKILQAAVSVGPAISAASTFVDLSLFTRASTDSRDFSAQKQQTHNEQPSSARLAHPVICPLDTRLLLL